MKKIIAVVFVLAFVFLAYGQSSPSEEAEARFARGEYFEGMGVLTPVLNDPDPVRRALAFQTYARFYEDLVGNTDYALMLYGNILGINLPEDNSIKASAKKEISRLKSLKAQYRAEDALLKGLQPPEIISPDKNSEQVAQLRSIIDKKPDFYRLHEVYYRLGRNYIAMGSYRQAYLLLEKSLELKPAINYYLPVDVHKNIAYAKWVRSTIKLITRGIIGVLLIVTIIAFYLSRPWRWLRLRHLITGLTIAILWLIILSISYILLVHKREISDKTIVDISAAVPCFVSFGPENPNWQVVKDLFVYGLIGLSGLFVFSIGISRIKYRGVVLLINVVFALLLFATLMTIFYMQNCDQKSAFSSDAQNGILHYINGGNYFVSFSMEPYVLTNPQAYPNLAINNITDVHMREWIQKYCPLSLPANQLAP